MGDGSNRASLGRRAPRTPRRRQEHPPGDRALATSSGRSGSKTSDDGPSGLSRVVEAEIIPRLMLLARMGGDVNPGECGDVQSEEIEALLAHAITRDLAGAAALVDALRDRGASDEAVCLALVAPAARDVGRLWEEDEIDFAQATMALFTLHGVVRHIGKVVGDGVGYPAEGRRVLLGMACGDQHTLGIVMVGEFLRRAGWDVWQETDADPSELREMAAAEWFDAIGLSAAHVDNLGALAGEVRALRTASLNPAVRLIVGGHVYREHSDVAAQVGADAAAGDAREAVTVLANFFKAAADQ